MADSNCIEDVSHASVLTEPVPSGDERPVDAIEGASTDAPPSFGTVAPPTAASVPRAGVPRAPWAPETPPAEEPGSPRHGMAAAMHFLIWNIAAVLGVVVAFFVIQVLAVVVASVFEIACGGMSASVDTLDDTLMAAMIASQLAIIAVFVPWWRHVRKRGIGMAPRAETVRGQVGARVRRIAISALAIVLLGIGLQLCISLLLNIILPLFPDVLREYEELMDSAGMGDVTALGVLSTAVLAPVSEELTVRGVTLQFALRGVTPSWHARLSSGAYGKLRLTAARFWVANAVQALAFGALHLNVTQGVYAFAIGLVLGWMFGRTGRLRHAIALHVVINFSSYFGGELYGFFSLFGGDIGVIMLSVACVLGGTLLFRYETAHAGGLLVAGAPSSGERCAASARLDDRDVPTCPADEGVSPNEEP